MIYLIHPDITRYKSFVISSKEAMNKLGDETMFHFDPRPRSYIENWQPLELEFASLSNSTKTKLPDITTRNGRLFLSCTAYEALHHILTNHGEFLPVTYKANNGYLFNVLTDAKNNNALNTKLSTYNKYGDIQSVVFHENKLSNTTLLRTEFDSYQGIYCTDIFKNAVEGANLKGITFSIDLGNIFPPDETAAMPSKH